MLDTNRLMILSVGDSHYFIEDGLTLDEIAQLTDIFGRAHRVRTASYSRGGAKYKAEYAEDPDIDLGFELLDPRRVDLAELKPEADGQIEPVVGTGDEAEPLGVVETVDEAEAEELADEAETTAGA